MYLYVEMFAGWTAFQEAQLGATSASSCKRIVKIKLTDEQLEKIKPKKTGKSGTTEYFESVNVLCLQED